MLKAEKVSVRVAGCDLLNELDFVLEVGEVVALMGPNGAGKSTLLKALAGEIAVSTGRVKLNDKALACWSINHRARMRAVLPQHLDLAFPFSAWEVALLGRMPHHRGTPGRRDREVVAEVMCLLDVLDLADRPYTRLSGGERARVQLSRVFAQIWDEPADGEPRFLLLDEPTAPLDIAHQLGLMDRLRALRGRGVGVLMILHDINLAAAHADRIVLLRNGIIKADGAPKEVMTPATIRAVFEVDASVVEAFQCKHPWIAFESCSSRVA